MICRLFEGFIFWGGALFPQGGALIPAVRALPTPSGALIPRARALLTPGGAYTTNASASHPGWSAYTTTRALHHPGRALIPRPRALFTPDGALKPRTRALLYSDGAPNPHRKRVPPQPTPNQNQYNIFSLSIPQLHNPIDHKLRLFPLKCTYDIQTRSGAEFVLGLLRYVR